MTAEIIDFPVAKIIRFPQPSDEQIRLARILERELYEITERDDARPSDSESER